MTSSRGLSIGFCNVRLQATSGLGLPATCSGILRRCLVLLHWPDPVLALSCDHWSLVSSCLYPLSVICPQPTLMHSPLLPLCSTGITNRLIPQGDPRRAHGPWTRGRGLLLCRSSLTFLAVDGCREQVTLNLLVLLKGTLYLCPCHELMDQSGNLPKFLKGQKTNWMFTCHLKLEVWSGAGDIGSGLSLLLTSLVLSRWDSGPAQLTA